MKRLIFTTIILVIIVALSLTTFSGLALARNSKSANNSGCVDVEITLVPDIATYGHSVTVTGTVKNCGDKTERITLLLTRERDSTMIAIGKSSFVLNAGDERTKIVVFKVTKRIPAGIYIVTAKATSKNGGYDDASATLTIY